MRAAPFILAALSASSLTGGCTALAVAGAAGATMLVAKDRTLGEGIDDTTGATEVRTRLLASDFSAYSRITAEMAQGRLLLAGSVPTMEHKIEAERIAWSVAPVRVVENNLEVGPQRDMWRGSWDAWITTEIRTRFLSEDFIKSLNFNVETHRGTVYLMGVARSEDMLQRAVEIARHVGGVEKVVSYIELRPRSPEQRAAHLAAARTGAPVYGAPVYDGATASPMATAAEDQPEITPYVPMPRRQTPPSGRRLEVRYPDEAQGREVFAAPDAFDDAPEQPRPVRRTASDGRQSTGVSGTGISGFGRDWSTPRQAGADESRAARSSTRDASATDDAVLDRSSGAPLQISRR